MKLPSTPSCAFMHQLVSRVILSKDRVTSSLCSNINADPSPDVLGTQHSGAWAQRIPKFTRVQRCGHVSSRNTARGCNTAPSQVEMET